MNEDSYFNYYSLLSPKSLKLLLSLILGTGLLLIIVFIILFLADNIIEQEYKIIVENMFMYEDGYLPIPIDGWSDLPGPKVGAVTCLYGRSNSRFHTGIDLAGVGTDKDDVNIFSVLPGKVVVSEALRNEDGTYRSYGEYVVIEHNLDELDDDFYDLSGKIYTLYAHMQTDSRVVFEGDEVEQGQVLGTMGNTGNSFGRHLHFEIKTTVRGSSEETTIDPFFYLFGQEAPKGEN